MKPTDTLIEAALENVDDAFDVGLQALADNLDITEFQKEVLHLYCDGHSIHTMTPILQRAWATVRDAHASLLETLADAGIEIERSTNLYKYILAYGISINTMCGHGKGRYYSPRQKRRKKK